MTSSRRYKVVRLVTELRSRTIYLSIVQHIKTGYFAIVTELLLIIKSDTHAKNEFGD